jgi:putative ABC transport system ATP-binding protein
MIRSESLSFAYSNQDAIQFPDLECSPGEALLILGQSGTGKTTLLHLLGGLMPAQQGSIEINGVTLNSLKGKAIDHFRGQHIGIIFQKPHFVRSLTVKENIFLAGELAGKKVDENWFKKLMEGLRVQDKASKYTFQLSEGEKQRVAIARALINKPALVLADEPSSALDDINTNELIELLQNQSEQANASLIIVTHDKRLKDRFEHKIELR